MNILTNIFSEYFWNTTYRSIYGRRYMEYICEKKNGYSGKICFFHFADYPKNTNAKENIHILNFVRTFYSWAYKKLYPAMKFAIQNDMVITINSFTEYNFIIKFQNTDPRIWLIISYILTQSLGRTISIDTDVLARFYEISISLENDFRIIGIKTYIEEKTFDSLLTIEPGYIDSGNVSMVLSIKDENFETNSSNTDAILVKLINPILFSNSLYLQESYWWALKPYFDFREIYVSFIETHRDWTRVNDLIYFTKGYSILA